MKFKNPNYSDILRQDYKGFMEPVLLTGCNHQAEKLGITRSKYIRYAVINQLIKDGFPLMRLTNKFNAFYMVIPSNK